MKDSYVVEGRQAQVIVSLTAGIGNVRQEQADAGHAKVLGRARGKSFAG